ncbi:MAG TPA: transglycosylase SLT domain-containing protein [Xanthomonadaceae bacterium]|jgi:membrane-bound lytic murein transglycosylase D
MRRTGQASFPTALLAAAIATCLLAGCEPEQNTRPATAEQSPISIPVPLPEPPPIVTSDLPPEDSAPLTGPSKAPLPAEGDTLTSGQVLERLRARLSSPTCIVGPNNTRWRHKYAGYPQHFADEVEATLPLMLVVLDELETHHLPAEFAFIPIVESWYRPDTRSFGGAAGMWQMLAETARNNGATVTGSYDGRLSTLDATDAAMNYLGKLQGMFNDWRLSAMAYNSGEYRLAKTMSPDELAARGVGGVHYRRPGGLAWTTYEYVSKMRALDCMLAQPQRQGIPFDPSVPIKHWIPYTMPADIESLDELAHRLGIDAEELKTFNHGYHNGRIAADAPRTLLVPASTRSRWAAAGTPSPQVPSSTSTTVILPPSMRPSTMPAATGLPTSSGVPATNAASTTTMPVPAAASNPAPAAPDVHTVRIPPTAATATPSTATTSSSGTTTTPSPPAMASSTKAVGVSSGTTPAATSAVNPRTPSTTSNSTPGDHPLPSFVPPASTTTVTPAPAAHSMSTPTPPAATSPAPTAAKVTPGIATPATNASQVKPSAPSTDAVTPPANPGIGSPTPAASTPTNTAAHEEHAPPMRTPTMPPASSTPEPSRASAAPLTSATTTAVAAPSPAASTLQPQPQRSAHAAGTTSTVAPNTSSTVVPPGASTMVAGHSTTDVHASSNPAPQPQAPTPAAPPPSVAPNIHAPTAPPAAVSPPPAATVAPVTPPLTAAATPGAAPPAAPRTYKVQLGDSLDTIAQHFKVSAADLRTWNHLTPDTSLYVDQVLKLEP